MNLDWLVIGGGIHGVHLSARLLGEGEVSRDRLCIVDPGVELLERWRTCSATTGMTHLRSAAVHHVDLDPWSLKRFAGKKRHWAPGLFRAPYERPALSLFNRHCERVIEDYGLAKLHVRDRALRCQVECDGVRVTLASGRELISQRLVLAIGAGDQPHWPAWAPREELRVQHIFAQQPTQWPRSPETVAVVGGGISAGQVALRLQEEGHDVHFISRHSLREHQFDSAPGWLGPKFMTGFQQEEDFDRRRALISRARFTGSMPPDVRRALSAQIASGDVHWHQATVQSLEDAAKRPTLRLSTDVRLKVDRVLLATGFAPHRPGGALIDDLITSASLPCASCGYPVVDTHLRWHPRVYVSGPLAELELGPAARNIAGARRAGDRLLGGLRRSTTPADPPRQMA